MGPSATTTAIIRQLVDSLDLEVLGEIYCDFGGREFWQQQLPAVIELGSAWGAALTARLATGGSSLYVGAGVGELPAMVTEVLDRGRTVVAVNLRAAECAALNAALAAAGLAGRLVVECRDAATATQRRYDHLAMVSVLDDPETFPTLSAVGYGRVHPVDLDVAAFAAEKQRLEDLLAAVLASLRRPAVVTTTFEEAPWILAWAERCGVDVVADEAMHPTAVVGDPVGFLELH